MVAASVLVVGVLSMIGALVASLRLVAVNRETARAHDAARAMVEGMQAVQFDRIFSTYNANGNDDFAGAGSAPGATFAVDGLRAQAGAGAVGTIEFPTINGGAQLSESVVDPGLGMPRDLDGDNAVRAGALATGYLMLPVRVRVRWRGAAGDRELQLVSLLVAR